MLNRIFGLVTMAGQLIKDNNLIDLENADYNKLATITEKAINFSERAKLPLSDCIIKKVEEMNNGFLLVKDHGTDDYVRGIIAGIEIGNAVENRQLIEEAETEWDARCFDGVEETVTLYKAMINNAKRRKQYRDMGMITVQELTRKMLKLMDDGMKDKYVIQYNRNFTKLTGNTASVIGEINNMPNGIEKDDLIMIS